MSITYFPFDAVVDSDGNYDRTYTSEQFALYFSKLFSNGVYGADSTGLQVTALKRKYVYHRCGRCIFHQRQILCQ